MPSNTVGRAGEACLPRALLVACPDCSSASSQPPPVTLWWRSTSAGAWVRTTRSPNRHPTPCPSQAPWMTTLPKLWATHGFRSKQPRTAHPAAPSRPHAGASQPAPLPTWSATATPRPWSPEGTPPSGSTRICMVCLSFEQSVLQNKTKKNWVGRGVRDGLFAKTMLWGFCPLLSSYSLGILIQGASNVAAGMTCGTSVSCSILTSCLGYQRNL